MPLKKIFISEILDITIPQIEMSEELKDKCIELGNQFNPFPELKLNSSNICNILETVNSSSFLPQAGIKLSIFLYQLFFDPTKENQLSKLSEIVFEVQQSILYEILKIPIDYIQNPTDEEYIVISMNDGEDIEPTLVEVHSRSHDHLSTEDILKQWQMDRSEEEQMLSIFKN